MSTIKLIIINAALLLLHIPGVRNAVLNMLGMRIAKSAKIGICIVISSDITIGNNSRIKSFNLVRSANLRIGEDSSIGMFNRFWGDFNAEIGDQAHIGNFCIFQRGRGTKFAARSTFFLGRRSNITSQHYLDMSDDIEIQTNSVVGGRNSQFWTHGFIHFNRGETRATRRAKICIGHGVYIGASTILNPGTNIGDDINIGAGCVIAGTLTETGLYVNQKPRLIKTGTFEEFSSKRTVLLTTDNPTIID